MALKGNRKMYETATGSITDYSGNSLTWVTGNLASWDMWRQWKFVKSIKFTDNNDYVAYNGSDERVPIPVWWEFSMNIWYNKDNVAWLTNTTNQRFLQMLSDRSTGGLLWYFIFGCYDGSAGKYGLQDASPSNLNLTDANSWFPADYKRHSFGSSHSWTSAKVYVDWVLKLSGNLNSRPNAALNNRPNWYFSVWAWAAFDGSWWAINGRVSDLKWFSDERPPAYYKNEYAYWYWFF